MDIHLPTLTIQPDWTAESQLTKINEEYLEVVEAVKNGDPINTIKEALDLMQTAKTLIVIVAKEWGIRSLKRFMVEHFDKLRRKGYME